MGYAANLIDGLWLLKRLAGYVRRLEVVFADEAYRGTPPSLARRVFGRAWRIVSRCPEQQGFALLLRRWIVGRTFAWLQGYCRCSKDAVAKTL